MSPAVTSQVYVVMVTLDLPKSVTIFLYAIHFLLVLQGCGQRGNRRFGWGADSSERLGRVARLKWVHDWPDL